MMFCFGLWIFMQNFTVLCELDDGWIRWGWKLLKFYNTHLLKISGWHKVSPKASSLQMDGDRRYEIKKGSQHQSSSHQRLQMEPCKRILTRFRRLTTRVKRSTDGATLKMAKGKARDWEKTFNGQWRFKVWTFSEHKWWRPSSMKVPTALGPRS